MDPTLDVVYTVDDWYDGPRAGAADYQGAPHWYRSVYLDTDTWNPDEDRFELTPLTARVLAWARKRSGIFHRWEDARRAGAVDWDGDEATFGAFPEEMDRYRELNRRIEGYVARHRPVALARGTFQPGCQKVCWQHLHPL